MKIVNRTLARAQELADALVAHTQAEASCEAWNGSFEVPEDTDILINATSIGLHPDSDKKPDIAYDTITEKMVVSDVVFNPCDTLFLRKRKARSQDCKRAWHAYLSGRSELYAVDWRRGTASGHGREAPGGICADIINRKRDWGGESFPFPVSFAMQIYLEVLKNAHTSSSFFSACPGLRRRQSGLCRDNQ